jgi:hypothetical protein
VPPGQDELFDLVSQATITDRLVETAEMRAIRSSVARLFSLRAVRLPQEQLTIRNLKASVITGIRRLWAIAEDPSAIKLRARWLLELLPDPYALAALSSTEGTVEMELDARAGDIALLAMPLFEVPQMIEGYQQWIEEVLMKPLQQSDPVVVERAVRKIDLLLANVASAEDKS